MKTVLITGVNGMLGRRVAKFFKEKGTYEVTGIGRGENAIHDIQYFRGDLTNPDFLKEVTSDPSYDVVVHCAAIVNLKYCEIHPEEAKKLHVDVSVELAKAFFKSTFFYVSTDAVYGEGEGNWKEIDIAAPCNNYALTKLNGEQQVLSLHDSVYALRVNIYGYNEPMRGSLFEWGYQSISKGSHIKGYENVFFNPLYVGQLAQLIYAFEEKQPPSGVYNVGCDEVVSKFEFLYEIADQFDLNTSLISRAKADFEQGILKRPYNTSLCVDKAKVFFDDIDLSFRSGIALLHEDLANSTDFEREKLLVHSTSALS